MQPFGEKDEIVKEHKKVGNNICNDSSVNNTLDSGADYDFLSSKEILLVCERIEMLLH